jgi:hypothetical protein
MSDDINKQSTIGDDVLWCCEAIAAELNVPLAKVYNLIRAKRIPVSKLGPKTVIASRRALRRALTLTP